MANPQLREDTLQGIVEGLLDRCEYETNPIVKCAYADAAIKVSSLYADPESGVNLTDLEEGRSG